MRAQEFPNEVVFLEKFLNIFTLLRINCSSRVKKMRDVRSRLLGRDYSCLGRDKECEEMRAKFSSRVADIMNSRARDDDRYSQLAGAIDTSK